MRQKDKKTEKMTLKSKQTNKRKDRKREKMKMREK